MYVATSLLSLLWTVNCLFEWIMNEGKETGTPDVTSIAEYVHTKSSQVLLIVKSLKVIVFVTSPMIYVYAPIAGNGADIVWVDWDGERPTHQLLDIVLSGKSLPVLVSEFKTYKEVVSWDIVRRECESIISPSNSRFSIKWRCKIHTWICLINVH